MRMYHGNHESTAALHLGLCLTEDDDAARAYGRGGYLHALDIDLTSLTVLDVDSYDHETNTAPGDDGQDRGADVIVFRDETDCAHRHETWRLMTPAALAACSLVTSAREED